MGTERRPRETGSESPYGTAVVGRKEPRGHTAFRLYLAEPGHGADAQERAAHAQRWTNPLGRGRVVRG